MTTKPKIPAIELKDLIFWYQPGGWQLHLPALTLDSGQHLFIRGASGTGKTTLLNLLAGITRPNKGELWVQGQPLHQLSAAKRDKLRASQIGVVFQQLNLIPYLSVLDNVLLRASFAGKPAKQLQQRAEGLLQALSLAPELWLQQVLQELQEVYLYRHNCRWRYSPECFLLIHCRSRLLNFSLQDL